MPRLLFLTLASCVTACAWGCGGDTATDDANPSSPSETTSETQQGAATSSQPFETPEAVYAAISGAMKDKDFRAVASLLTTDSQAVMAGGFIFGAGFVTMGDKDKEKELEELLGRHGVSFNAKEEPPDLPEDAGPEAMMKAITEPIEDLPAFIGEITAWIEKNSDDESGGFIELGELGEVTVDGDSATAVGETANGPQPIEFRRVDGSWLVHIPMPGPGGDMPPELEEVEGDATPGLGTLWYGDEAITLRHALAYKSKFFDDPCVIVLLTAKPINDRSMNDLKQLLKKEGNDDAFFVRGPQIKLSLDAEGQLMFVNGWVNNLSINTNSGIETNVAIDENRVHGTVAMPEAEEFDDTEYRFEAAFDVELMQVE